MNNFFFFFEKVGMNNLFLLPREAECEPVRLLKINC